MLSRVSSFSGPLSKLFTINEASVFTTNGLILRYEIGLESSYVGSGTNVVDLMGNSNATLVNAPTYSTNGYLTFDGFNEYLMTNTSLNSKLSPTNTSNISFFVWAYPIDNGVIVTEQGDTSLNGSGWHTSQLEMVNGVVKFGVWSDVGVVSVSSSISTPFNNWYYLGLTYDGTTLRGYVNGQLAASLNVSRLYPSELFYGIAANDSTSLGDGTYTNMKFGAFHVYNTALSDRHVSNNYNATKSDYIVTSNLLFWIDANDGISFSGGSINDLSGNNYTHSLSAGATSSSIFGVKCFDCAGTNYSLRPTATGPTLSNSGYTYVSWARIIPSSTSYRTLYRSTPNDHPLIIDIGTDMLGMYDNDNNLFYSSGYSITSVEEKWTQWSVTGDSNGSEFYINDVLVGTSSKSASGNKHDYIGNVPGQPFGYIGNTMMYNSKLSADQIRQNYDALKDVYKNGNFVIDNLKLYFNPNSLLSYPGTGTTVTDLTGNSLNGTLSNVTYSDTYFSFNGSSSQIAITDNALLEPGSGNWTIEVWFNLSSYSSQSQTIIGKFDPGGLSADISYAIRISNGTGNVRCDFSDGSTAVSTSSYTLSLNVWYQLVYVFNNVSNNIITYVNGSSTNTTVNNSVNSILNTTANLYLGSYNNGEYPQYFNGKMGIVRLYGSALSTSDISKNFEANRDIYGI